jgi:hypothetical protein
MYNVQDYSIHYNITVSSVIFWFGILLRCGKQLHDHIISLRGEVWTYKTSLTSPLFITVAVPGQWSCICVLGVMYMCVRGHVYVC